MSARAPPPRIMDLIKPRISASLKPTKAKSSQPTPSKKKPKMHRSFPFSVSSARLSSYRPVLMCAREYASSFFQEQVDAARPRGGMDGSGSGTSGAVGSPGLLLLHRNPPSHPATLMGSVKRPHNGSMTP
jgi:hypothetical protein